ncbi:zinc-finger-containing protein [Aquimarina algiphila]|uniref:Uncharacterized protein n=1 Tax=Aquimarina algiphila TaxID=2047982 RepID=A0A554VAS4_9FLAO|nr:zinc-finger-containing protein [Aquimarina algiphila]TSE03352.1 hypothetical protein FOF46_29565 [Aquimarina algiphila]
MILTSYQEDVLNAKICPYCKSTTEVVSETDVYGKQFKGRSMIRCRNLTNCGAYVGCHEDGRPLGRLANRQLRTYKREAHKWFDKLWREKYMERSEAYEKLADYLELPDEYTHIGMFQEKTCLKVIKWSKETYNNLKLRK